jgi:hypothetical protein
MNWLGKTERWQSISGSATVVSLKQPYFMIPYQNTGNPSKCLTILNQFSTVTEGVAIRQADVQQDI